MTRYVWNGGTGSYTDPTQWADGAVPLWDEGSTVGITGGTTTLQDVEPNNMTVEIGGRTDATAPRLVLDNAALGPGLDVRVTGVAPVSAHDFIEARVIVQGYDTNYGAIEAIHDPGTANSGALVFTLQPHSQLNNEGTISAGTTVTADRSQGYLSLNFSNGDSRTPGVLNNDGQINILNDTAAVINTTTIGTGVITLARTPGAEASTSPSLIFGGLQVAASQSVALEAGQLTLYQDLKAPQAFEGVISEWSPAAKVFLPGQAATSLQFTQTTATQGDLVVSGDNGGSPYAFDLKIAGQHTTDQFSFQLQPGRVVLGGLSGIAGTYVSISA